MYRLVEESLVYYELVEDLLHMTILDVSDLKRKLNFYFGLNESIMTTFENKIKN